MYILAELGNPATLPLMVNSSCPNNTAGRNPISNHTNFFILFYFKILNYQRPLAPPPPKPPPPKPQNHRLRRIHRQSHHQIHLPNDQSVHYPPFRSVASTKTNRLSLCDPLLYRHGYFLRYFWK